ncbi:hypothetical protein [Saccharothrix lopnurensis]|uniref:Uncharacterized protein n=1 Tax=Saccharothrix lopnurensis TaxID=1670621 RepID=A0ABW1P8C6_9PSEU
MFDDSVEVQTGPGCRHPSAADPTLVECDDSGVTTVVVYAGGGGAAHLVGGHPGRAARLIGFADAPREPHGIPVRDAGEG